MKPASMVSCPQTMCADLLLLGGGHTHLPLIQAIPAITSAGHRVTCVSPSAVHYYSGMGPGMLGGTYEPADIRFPIKDMVVRAGGTFVEDRAVRIDAAARSVRLAGGTELSYDVLSVNTGSTVAHTVRVNLSGKGGPTVFRAKPIEDLVQARAAFLRLLEKGGVSAAVVGGGPAAVEIAGNLARLARSAETVNVSVELLAGRRLLPAFPRRAARLAARALGAAGVLVRAPARVAEINDTGVIVDGSAEPFDLVVLAPGIVPSKLFLESGLPVGPDGSLAADDFLHALGYPEIYAGGDCMWFTPRPLPRAGVFSVREAPVLVHNVIASLGAGTARRLVTFRRSGAYMLLMNLGDGTALFWRKLLGFPIVVRGAALFALKDRIDRAFMRRFGSEADCSVSSSREGK